MTSTLWAAGEEAGTPFSKPRRPRAMGEQGWGGKWLGGGCNLLHTPANPRQAHNRTKAVLGWVGLLTSPQDHCTHSPSAVGAQCVLGGWTQNESPSQHQESSVWPASGARLGPPAADWGRWWASDSHPEGASCSHRTGSLSGGLDQLGRKGRRQ